LVGTPLHTNVTVGIIAYPALVIVALEQRRHETRFQVPGFSIALIIAGVVVLNFLSKIAAA